MNDSKLTPDYVSLKCRLLHRPRWEYAGRFHRRCLKCGWTQQFCDYGFGFRWVILEPEQYLRDGDR